MKRILRSAVAVAVLFGLSTSCAKAANFGNLGGATTQANTGHTTHSVSHPLHLFSQLWTCDPDKDGFVDASWLTVNHSLAAKLTTDDDGEGFDEVNAGVYIEQGLPVTLASGQSFAFDCKFVGVNAGEDPDCYHGPFLIVSSKSQGVTTSIFLGPAAADSITGPNADGWFHLVFTNDGNSFPVNAFGVGTTHHTVSVLIRNVAVAGSIAVPDTHHHAAKCVFGTPTCEDFFLVEDYCGPGSCRETPP